MNRTRTNYWVWSNYYESWLNVDRRTYDRKKENHLKRYQQNQPTGQPGAPNRHSWSR